MALSRVEARELISSASLGLGIGFSGLVLYMFGILWAADHHGGLVGSFELYPIYVHPLAGLAVLAAHRARTRSTRDGTQELFDACPTSQATRSVGHLLTAWVPTLIAVWFLLAMTAVFARSVTVVYGDVGARQVAALLGAAVLGAGGAVLGVALARWAPWTLVPVAAVIAVGFGAIRLGTAGDRPTEPVRQLSTWLNDPDRNLHFTAPHWLAHHLWILALVGLVAVLALVRDQRGPRVVTAGGLIVLAAVASGFAATRPIDTADAERIAARINEPEADERCIDVGGLAMCTLPSDVELAEHFADIVAPVVAAAPPGALDGWRVRHNADVNRADLDPEVRALLRDDADGNLIPIQMIGHREAEEGARFWVGLTAVGITADTVSGGTLSVDRQARGVVALWLATRGLDVETATRMVSLNETVIEVGTTEKEGTFVSPWPDSCYAGPAPVTWALTDLEAARMLIAAPEADVARLLDADWDHLTDRATSTDELLVTAGLPPARGLSTITRLQDVSTGVGEC
jgi:hypothetical protein